jgi:peroxiredoxin
MTPGYAPSSEETGRGKAQPVELVRAREEARRVTERLVGRSIPSLILASCKGDPVNPKELEHGSVVIYLYPGSRASPDDGDDTPMVDAVQHRAFRDHYDEIAARRFGVAGISSQPEQAQYASAKANRLQHTLLTDPECRLAQELELPTFMLDGASWYQRLTLVASGGRIDKVFFPVTSAARSPAQALAWLTVRAS